MKTINNYCSKDVGIMLGSTIRHMLRNTDIIYTLLVLPASLLLLLLCILGSVLEILLYTASRLPDTTCRQDDRPSQRRQNKTY